MEHPASPPDLQNSFLPDCLPAFLPGSLIDVRPIRDTAHLEGKELEFKVIKLDQKRNNIVVSRRAVMEAAKRFPDEEIELIEHCLSLIHI